MINAATHIRDHDEHDDHYLKSELNSLLRRRDDVNTFLSLAVQDGVWYWDLENPEHEWMSPTFWRTLGYEPKAMPHKAAAWQSIIHPDDFKTASDNFRKHCADPDHPYDQIVRYKHADGRTVWIRCRGMAIRDDRGKPVRMLGAHVDITALKTKEHELAEHNARLKLREEQLEFHNQSLKDFASVVAHDLKAPLRQTTVFLSMLEADLKNASPLTETSQNAIDGMNTVLDRMRRIVKSLYELFKVGALDIDPRPTPMRVLIDDAIALSKDHLDARDARIEIAEMPTLPVDPDLIAQVFQNLLINACKYSNADRLAIIISSKSDKAGLRTNIYVDDNGSGVPAGSEERIFEPYMRLPHAPEIEGSGIGLALCRRIMSLHRGSIYVDPNFKSGARLVLSFPPPG